MYLHGLLREQFDFLLVSFVRNSGVWRALPMFRDSGLKVSTAISTLDTHTGKSCSTA
jgi:hypothetical protein